MYQLNIHTLVTLNVSETLVKHILVSCQQNYILKISSTFCTFCDQDVLTENEWVGGATN